MQDAAPAVAVLCEFWRARWSSSSVIAFCERSEPFIHVDDPHSIKSSHLVLSWPYRHLLSVRSMSSALAKRIARERPMSLGDLSFYGRKKRHSGRKSSLFRRVLSVMMKSCLL